MHFLRVDWPLIMHMKHENRLKNNFLSKTQIEPKMRPLEVPTREEVVDGGTIMGATTFPTPPRSRSSKLQLVTV